MSLRADIITSSPELRDLAREVELATEGAVTIAYATRPSHTTYYVFDVTDHELDPRHDRMNESDALAWLATVLARVRREAS